MPSQFPNRADRESNAAEESLAVDDALRRILDQVKPIRTSQKAALRDSLGRTLAQTVISPIDVPSHTNSAMDGFALRGTDLPEDGARELELVGSALAGHAFAGQVLGGQCVKIMTGASMPPGTDTVVMLEQAACRVRKRPGRTELARGILRRGEDGVLRVELTGRQGSGVLSSMSLANCFIVLPHEKGDLARSSRTKSIVTN